MKAKTEVDFKIVQLRIRYTASRRNIAMGELQDHLGVSRRTYYYWFNQKVLRLKDLNAIANYLNVDICYLLGCKGSLSDEI